MVEKTIAFMAWLALWASIAYIVLYALWCALEA